MLLCSERKMLWAEQLKDPGASLEDCTLFPSPEKGRPTEMPSKFRVSDTQGSIFPGCPWGHTTQRTWSFFALRGIRTVKFTLTYEPQKTHFNIIFQTQLYPTHSSNINCIVSMKQDMILSLHERCILSPSLHYNKPFQGKPHTLLLGALTMLVYFHWLYSILKHL